MFGVQRSVEIVGLTFVAPVMAIKGDLAPELVRPIGLPGMTQVAAEATTAAVSSGWWYPILLITGAFSAGLAVANMLPLPALDGGRLLFVAIEAVRGQRVSPEREGLIHLVGMVVLLSLMVFISFYDLVVPPVGRGDPQRWFDAGTIETDGFPAIVLSLAGQQRGQQSRIGSVGAVLVPDADFVQQAYDEARLTMFSLEVAVDGVGPTTAYFSAEQKRFVVGFSRYRVRLYNTTDKTVTANLYAYLTE